MSTTEKMNFGTPSQEAPSFDLKNALEEIGAPYSTYPQYLEKLQGLSPNEQKEWVELKKNALDSRISNAFSNDEGIRTKIFKTMDELRALSSEERQKRYEEENNKVNRLKELNEKAGILSVIESLSRQGKKLPNFDTQE